MAKNENTKIYELMVVLKPLLPDDVRKRLHKELVDLVESQKGKVLDVEVWGKRYLTYKILGHNEGYYIIYNYEIAPRHIGEMTRQLKLKQEILRSLITEVEHPEDIGTGIKKKEINI
ncbi:30S ribosomal protein S6 [bacterium]|nr:30S ribosomal protein S6 [bacterium]